MNRNRKKRTAHSMNYDAADRAALRSAPFIRSVSESDGMNFDSTDEAAVFFARELDYVKGQTYDQEYPDMTALRTFPITHDVPEGAETVTFYSYERTGMAKIIANYATDLPRADVKGTPTTVDVKSVGTSYGYSVQEMRASRMTGKSLDTRKAEAAHFQNDTKQNMIAWAGDPDNNLVGILTTGNNVPLYTVPACAAGGTSMEKMTPEEILGVFNGIVKSQAIITSNVEKSDTVFLPSSVYIHLATTKITDSEKTILTFLKENQPYLKNFIDAPELEADSACNPYKSRVMVFCKLDERKFGLEIPMEFYQYPAQPTKLEVEVPCESRIAGVMIYYPMSLMIASGI